MYRKYGYDFVDSPSGLIVPQVAEVTRDGLAALEVAFELDLPGGTTNFLRADGTWADPGSGGGGSAGLVLLDTAKAAGGEASLQLTWATAYDTLLLVGSMQTLVAGTAGSDLHIRLDGSTSAFYNSLLDGSATSGATSGKVAKINSNGHGGGLLASFETKFHGFNRTGGYAIQWVSTGYRRDSSGGPLRMECVGEYGSGALQPITQIDLYAGAPGGAGTFIVNSNVSLFGLAFAV